MDYLDTMQKTTNIQKQMNYQMLKNTPKMPNVAFQYLVSTSFPSVIFFCIDSLFNIMYNKY